MVVKVAVAAPEPDRTRGTVDWIPVWSANRTDPVGVLPFAGAPVTVAVNVTEVPATKEVAEAVRAVFEAWTAELVAGPRFSSSVTELLERVE